MNRQSRIETILRQALAPSHLHVEDQSERHHGHGGWQEGGETHFAIDIAAAAFADKNRIARHRMVTDLLAAEFTSGLHALTIEARAPGE
jgi:BolA protein